MKQIQHLHSDKSSKTPMLNETLESAEDEELNRPSKRLLRAGTVLNLEDPYDQRIVEGCLDYTGLSYAANASSALSKVVNRDNGSAGYQHFILITPPEEMTSANSNADIMKMFTRLMSHLTLMSNQKRNVFIRIPGKKHATSARGDAWQCADPQIGIRSDNGDLLPRDCPLGSVVIVKSTAHAVASAILAPGSVPQSYRDAYLAKQNPVQDPSRSRISEIHQPKPTPTSAAVATSRLSFKSQALQQLSFSNKDDAVAESASLLPLAIEGDEKNITVRASGTSGRRRLPSHKARGTKARGTEGIAMGSISSMLFSSPRASGVATTTAPSATPAATTPIQNTKPVLNQLARPNAIPAEVLALLHTLEDDLSEETRALIQVVEAQAEQIKQVKQDIGNAANVALQAHIAQQDRVLEQLRQKRAKFTGAFIVPQVTVTTVGVAATTDTAETTNRSYSSMNR